MDAIDPVSFFKSLKINREKKIDPVEGAGLPTGRYPGGFRRAKGSGRRRILGPDGRANAYHVMSRTAGGEMLFGEVEKRSLHPHQDFDAKHSVFDGDWLLEAFEWTESPRP